MGQPSHAGHAGFFEINPIGGTAVLGYWFQLGALGKPAEALALGFERGYQYWHWFGEPFATAFQLFVPEQDWSPIERLVQEKATWLKYPDQGELSSEDSMTYEEGMSRVFRDPDPGDLRSVLHVSADQSILAWHYPGQERPLNQGAWTTYRWRFHPAGSQQKLPQGGPFNVETFERVV